MPTVPMKSVGEPFSHLDANVPFALENAVVTTGDLVFTLGNGRARWGDITFELNDVAGETEFTRAAIPAAADTFYIVLDFNAGTPQIITTDLLPSAAGDADWTYLGSATVNATPVVTGWDDLRGFLNVTSPRLVSGNATVPAIAFSGDPNTGIFRRAIDEINFSTGAVERLRITANEIQPILPVRGNDGGVGAPAYSFIGDSDTGIYKSAGGLAISVDGVMVADFITGGKIRGQNGTAAFPAFSFVDSDTGMYLSSPDELAFTTGGVQRFRIGTTASVFETTIQAQDGTAAAPSITFESDPNTGMYSATSDIIGFSTAGVQRLRIGTVAVVSEIPIYAQDGSAAAPGVAFEADPDTGMYGTAGAVRFTSAGAQRMSIGTVVTSLVPLHLQDGSAAAPAYTFSSATTTGMYQPVATNIAFATGGTDRFLIANTLLRSYLPLQHPDGTALAPSVTFTSDTDTGLYRSATGTVHMVSDGVSVAYWDSGGLHTSDGTTEFDDGTALAPSITFASDPDTGIYKVNPDVIGFTTGGVQRLRISTTHIVNELPSLFQYGTAAGPGIAFEADTDTGIWSDTLGQIAFSANGLEALRIYGTVLEPAGVIRSASYGSAAGPTYSFLSDPDTGMFATAGNLRFAVGGVERFWANGAAVTIETAQLIVQSGTALLPSIAFEGDPNTGIYLASADTLSFTTGGALAWNININGDLASQNGSLILNDPGSVAAPSYSFQGDPNTGIYNSSGGRIAFSTDGVLAAHFAGDGLELPNDGKIRGGNSSNYLSPQDPGGALNLSSIGNVHLYIDADNNGTTHSFRIYKDGNNLTGIPVQLFSVGENGQVTIADGTAAVPGYSFANDLNTGIYRTGPESLGITTAGVVRLIVNDTYAAFSEQIRTGDGTALLPAHSFSLESDTGMYRSAASVLSFAVGGVERLRIGTVAAVSELPIYAQYGTALAPGVAWEGDPDTGLYGTAGLVGLSVGGVSRLSIGTVSVTTTLPLRAPDGTAAAPAYTFASDANTGMYRTVGDTLSFAAGGVEQLRIGTTAAIFETPLTGFQYGTALAPGIVWDEDRDTGIYGGVANVSIGTSGVARFSVTDTLLLSNVPYRGQYESAATPTYSFASDPDTGMFATSATLRFATGGVERIRVGASATTFENAIYAQYGTVLAPSIAFESDTDTGIYGTAGTFQFAVGGVHRGYIDGTKWFLKGNVHVYANGTAAAPALKIGSNLSEHGLYWGSATELGVTVDGVKSMGVKTTAVEFAVPVHAPDGTFTAPSIAFTNDATTGFYYDDMALVTEGGVSVAVQGRQAMHIAFDKGAGSDDVARWYGNENNEYIAFDASADSVALASSGVDVLTVSPASIVAAKQIQAIDGTVGAPAYSFSNDTDTGFYRATGTMNIVINGATEFAVTTSAAYVHPTILIINADGGNPSNSEIRFRNSADERLIHDDANNRYDFYEDGTISAATLRAGDFAVTSDASLKSNIRNAKSPTNTSRLAALATLAVKDYDVVGAPEGLPLLDEDGNEVLDKDGNLKRTSPTPKVFPRRGLLAQDYVAAFGETPTIIGTGTEEDPYGFNLYALLAETIGALSEVNARLAALENT